MRRVRDEWPLANPEVGYDLTGEEAETSGRHTGKASDLPAIPRPGSIEEPEAARRDRERGHRPEGDEVADLVADERVAPE